MIDVRWIRSLSQLDALAQPYDELLASLGDECAHYQREWIRCCLGAWGYGGAHRDESPSLAILLATDGQRAIGMAPLQIEHKPLSRFGLRRLHFLGENTMSLLHARPDFMVHPAAEPRACLDAFFRFLVTQRELEWDLLDLGLLPDTSANVPHLRALLPSVTLIPEPFQTAVVDLSEGFDAYFGGLSKNLRQDVRKRRNRIKREGVSAVFHSASRLQPELWSEFERVYRLRQEKLRQQGLRRFCFSEDPIEKRAILGLLDWAERAGTSYYVWLEIEGRLAALCVNVRYRRTLYWIMTALDDALVAYAPGKLLMLHLFEQTAAEHGTLRIDLGVGLTQLKRQLGTRLVSHSRWQLTRDSLASRLRYGMFRLAKRLTARRNA